VSAGLWSVLHRAQHQFDSGHALQAGGCALYPLVGGLSLRNFRPAGAAGGLRELATGAVDVPDGPRDRVGGTAGVGAVDAAGVNASAGT
jgi:hypothetical protein